MKNELVSIVDNWKSKKVLVVGDLTADIYLDGHIARISREAPVLVLEPTAEKTLLGAAANVIHNGATLGALMYAGGIVGEDGAGEQLVNEMSKLAVNTEFVIATPHEHTISKQRIMAWDHAVVRQHIVRIDRVPKNGFSANEASELAAKIVQIIPEMDAVILSDYGNGTLNSFSAQTIIDECNKNNVPSFVDSRYAIKDYSNISYIKQNESELAAFTGVEEFAGKEALIIAGEALRAQLNAKAALISLGTEGVMVIQTGRIDHIPVKDKSEIYDVNGAGDTLTMVAALALATGADIVDSAKIANYAAGVVVRKMGTATLTVDELKAVIDKFE
ncbi:MAG: PfkB family carbohydrate kinase [Bacillota bacterium]